ncbi:hypothetical protein E3N88_00636 [Mikania micrantha]|uniref:Uncharacterized protein n=1 Tax=Mikania micrantha TaxID=192012 RepID=A0A5N6Q1D1_9ASTR|nr:hypothetical protein E3N88_00636 [Mikania micrantha]
MAEFDLQLSTIQDLVTSAASSTNHSPDLDSKTDCEMFLKENHFNSKGPGRTYSSSGRGRGDRGGRSGSRGRGSTRGRGNRDGYTGNQGTGQKHKNKDRRSKKGEPSNVLNGGEDELHFNSHIIPDPIPVHTSAANSTGDWEFSATIERSASRESDDTDPEHPNFDHTPPKGLQPIQDVYQRSKEMSEEEVKAHKYGTK